MIWIFSWFRPLWWRLAIVTGVVTVSLVSSLPQALQVEAAQLAQAARPVASAGALSVTTEQSLDFFFSVQNNQLNALPFRLALQDAETGRVFGQKDVQVATGGIGGGGCIQLMVDQGGQIFIDGQPTDFQVPPGTRKAIVGVLFALRPPGHARIVASLQLFDNTTKRTIVALPALP